MFPKVLGRRRARVAQTRLGRGRGRRLRHIAVVEAAGRIGVFDWVLARSEMYPHPQELLLVIANLVGRNS